MGLRTTVTLCAALVALCWGGLIAQEPPAGRGGRQAGPPQFYWVQKTKGGVFIPPNKPLTRLADLKKMHAGQANWKEMAVRVAQSRGLLTGSSSTCLSRSRH